MEKYGTIPPRFTKEWWKYFWDYYKLHTISTAAVVVLIATTVYQCATQTKYDLSVSYVGEINLPEEEKEKLSECLYPEIDEITGNDKLDIFHFCYTFSQSQDNKNAGEYEYALQVKLSAELQAGDADIYIISSPDAADFGSMSNCFCDITDYTDKEYPDDMLIKDENGRAYGVSLANSKIFADSGIDSSNLYLTVRSLYEMNSTKEKFILNHNNSLKAASALLKE